MIAQPEVLLDRTDSLFRAFDTFLNLAVRDSDERAGFSELFIQMGSIISVAPLEMHLKSFRNNLKIVPEPFTAAIDPMIRVFFTQWLGEIGLLDTAEVFGKYSGDE